MRFSPFGTSDTPVETVVLCKVREATNSQVNSEPGRIGVLTRGSVL